MLELLCLCVVHSSTCDVFWDAFLLYFSQQYILMKMNRLCFGDKLPKVKVAV